MIEIIFFYIASLIAIITTLRAITHTQPVYALLYLIISFIAIACILFLFGAYFAGFLEIIIYAGTIMVLFIFVNMMIPTNKKDKRIIFSALVNRLSKMIPILLLVSIIIMLCYSISQFTTIHSSSYIEHQWIEIKNISIKLFGPYFFVIELASILLLSGMIVAFHFGRNYHPKK
ncbi:NADH-quinone oxidoreductase subunit J [Candidatus Schneideria nysicola]|uniref:NADH-quinone oxidoreductase subunit J n=1 Tax=Candidatus Schneideria nysicola TaxID=1081631 RepID=UPI001CAA41B3|nr:NADH-quinone oxidoreductase subunit J [Candidatus Schneideria nysicola]UAJ65520.1 NADH-quinone oxidoreductase subunit J [Candidatus Schneideria nysicola]